MPKKSARKRRKNDRIAANAPRWIPSEQDFARAKALMRERDRGLNTVGQIVLARFRKICSPCYGFYVLSQDEPNFRAYFFVEGRGAVDQFASSAEYLELQELVYRELELAKRGPRNEISVEFTVEDRSMYLAK